MLLKCRSQLTTIADWPKLTQISKKKIVSSLSKIPSYVTQPVYEICYRNIVKPLTSIGFLENTSYSYIHKSKCLDIQITHKLTQHSCFSNAGAVAGWKNHHGGIQTGCTTLLCGKTVWRLPTGDENVYR